jgi:tetratricopeptide (TPR) repeat protein
MKARIALTVLPMLLLCGIARAQTYSTGCEAGDPDTRIAACSALIEAGAGTNSNLPVAFNNRGIGYADKGAYEQAIQDFNAAISLNPALALAYSNRGATYAGYGLFEKAVNDYNKAIELNADLRQPYHNRCFALAQLGHAEQAIADCDKAILMQAADPETLVLRGFVYFRMGRYADAIRNCDHALNLNSTMAKAFYIRGIAKLKLNDLNGQADIQRAKSLYANISSFMAQAGVGFGTSPEIATSATPFAAGRISMTATAQ